MATLIELNLQGCIHKIDPCLSGAAQEVRRIYVLPRMRDWLTGTLPGLASNWNLEESPAEQLDAFLAVFCSGEAIAFGQQFKPLKHLGDGVWEPKTADLRMFGWFQMKDCFVVTDFDTCARIKGLHMYAPYCAQSMRFRDGVGLDEPKYIVGEDPNDVVSNFYHP